MTATTGNPPTRTPADQGRTRRDQRGAAACHALTVCDEQGPGLVAADEILVGARGGPAGPDSAPADSVGSHWVPPASARAGRRGPSGARLWAQFRAHSLPSADVHLRPRASCARWSRTPADGGERWCAVLESV